MFASRMAGGCGLSAWASNSEVVRATAAEGDGPYLFEETVVPHFAHGPSVRKIPSGYALMHLGCGLHSKAKNCSDAAGDDDETGGSDSKHETGGSDSKPKRAQPKPPGCQNQFSVSVKTAPGLAGPWTNSTRVLLNSGDRAPAWFQTRGKAFTNPAPYVFPNGSALCTSSFGNTFFILATLSWVCVGIRRRRVLLSAVCA